MGTRILAALVGTACLATTARADDYIPPVVGGHTYAQHLITEALKRHSGVTAITVEGPRGEDKQVVTLGSTRDRAQVFQPVKAPVTELGGSTVAGRYVVRVPFMSNSGHRLGTIAVECASKAPSCDDAAEAIGKEMARATLSTKNAVDPFPYDAKFSPNTYAQVLTERTVAKHPDLLVMMIHATPPAGKQNVIIGSNIGRIGKVADEDDARVIDKGSTNLEVGGDADRFETELPLNDATGKRIGALGLVFAYRTSDDKEAIHQHGLAIRDEIARQIPTSAALFRPSR